MPKRKYHTDPAKLLAEGRKIVQTAEDEKYRHRVELVNLVLGGQIPSQLSEYVKESKNTITRWVKIADEQGFESLRSQKRVGVLPDWMQNSKTLLNPCWRKTIQKHMGMTCGTESAYQATLRRHTPFI